MGYLISETTREERQRIVEESIGNTDGMCDGCASGLIDMYQPYIDGEMELKEITMNFHARYVRGDDTPARSDCGWK